MDIDFADSLPLAIKFSIEPCLPITKAVTRHVHYILQMITQWLLEKPAICTILVTIALGFLAAMITFIFTIIFGTLCAVVLLLLLEGLLIAYSLILMCSLLFFVLYLFLIMSLIRSKFYLPIDV